MIEIAKAWEHELDVLHEGLGGLFRRAEPRQRSLAYLKGLLGTAERKNGWQLAEWMGEATPDGVQHLLERAQWEDESGNVNVIIKPKVLEQQRKEVLGASLLGVLGVWQCEGEVRHLVAQRLIDMSHLLGELPSKSRNFH